MSHMNIETAMRANGYYPDLTNQEIAKLLGCSVGTACRIRGGKERHIPNRNTSSYTGYTCENEVADILTCQGFEAKQMPFRHPFDILVNGKARIDVKAATKPLRIAGRSQVFVFTVRQGKRGDCDFYACYIRPLNKLFIIPASAIPDYKQLIHVSFSNHGGSKHRWHEYQDRYDLIDAFLHR